MKKLFLLGTMLGVAGTALAFGGVFNHGSKSSTYKGGVDAIGVHFGGEKKTTDSEPEEETCPEGISRARDGSCSVCDNGKVYLSYREDTCENEVSGCTSNDDCGDNEYCNLHREDDGSCDPPEEGTCEEIDTVDPVVIAGLGTVVMTSESLQWWAAQNWCRAQGKRLPSIDDLKCYIDMTTKVQAGVHTSSSAPSAIYCCAEGHDCDSDGELSSIFSALQNVSGYEDALYWTSSPYNSYCDPWYIDLPGGFIHHPGAMTNPALSTLCVD